MTHGKNHIYCSRCGCKLGFRQGSHWFLTEKAAPSGGDSFACVGPCKGNAKKSPGDAASAKGGKNIKTARG